MATKRKVTNTRPRDTSANRAKKNKDPRFQRFGKSNGSYKDGNSPHAYRLKAGAKPHEVVHHKSHDKKNSSKSNLAVLKNTKRSSAMAKHNKEHPTKALQAAAARYKNQGKPVPVKLATKIRKSFPKSATPGPLRRKR